jgi:hypothetical protein
VRIEADLAPPDERGGPALADWAEALMLVEDVDYMSASDLRGRLLEDGEPTEESDELTAENEQDELADYDDLDLYQTDVEALLREVELREGLAPTIYPFVRSDDGVRRAGGPSQPLYEFLLLLSLVNVPFRKESYSHRISRLFDLLAVAAITSQFAGGKAIRFGAPPQGDRPGGIKTGLKWLAGELGLVLNEEIPAGRHGGDAGVDVVAWRPFRDGRSGFLIFLAQCTVALDKEQKSKDIAEKLWRDYFTLKWDPLTALVVPYCVDLDDATVWATLGYSVTMVIDRMRLCELLEETEAVSIRELEAIIEWTREKRVELQLQYPDEA